MDEVREVATYDDVLTEYFSSTAWLRARGRDNDVDPRNPRMAPECAGHISSTERRGLPNLQPHIGGVYCSDLEEGNWLRPTWTAPSSDKPNFGGLPPETHVSVRYS